MNFSVATFVLRTGILLLFLSAPLQAQVAGAALSGTVTGPSGAAVANARVTVRNAATGQSTETQTDSFGSYHVQNLMSGDYDVSVSEEGFSPKAVKVTITAGAGQTVNLALTASPSGNVFHGRLLCHPGSKGARHSDARTDPGSQGPRLGPRHRDDPDSHSGGDRLFATEQRREDSRHRQGAFVRGLGDHRGLWRCHSVGVGEILSGPHD